MRLRLSYRTGTVLGCIGWLILSMLSAIVFGLRLASNGFDALTTGAALLSFGGLLFLASLYLEATARLAAFPRRMVCGIAVALQITAAVVMSGPCLLPVAP